MRIGYVRVSTREQNVELQIEALKSAGVEKIYEEKVSALKERPQLNNMLTFCRAGDVVVVWKFDRLARSLKNLIDIIELLKEKKVGFVSITEQIDTSTSIGKLFLQITGSFAEFERNLISERTIAGLQAAKERGRIGGRRRGLSDEARKKATAAKNFYLDNNDSMTVDEICEILNIGSKATFYRYLKALNVDLNRKCGRRTLKK